MEPAKTEIRLRELCVGFRLVVRSKKDWRYAVISAKAEDTVRLSVASPSGYNYRIRKDPDVVVVMDGLIPVIEADGSEKWRENLSSYDTRW